MAVESNVGLKKTTCLSRQAFECWTSADQGFESHYSEYNEKDESCPVVKKKEKNGKKFMALKQF